MGEMPRSITERALSDVFLNGMVTMIRIGVPERDAMISTLAALSDALREMTKRAIRVAETTPPSVVIHDTPPGHVLVGPDAREAIARALWEQERRRPGHYKWSSEWPGLAPGLWTYVYGDQADAVLAALGVRGGA